MIKRKPKHLNVINRTVWLQWGTNLDCRISWQRTSHWCFRATQRRERTQKRESESREILILNHVAKWTKMSCNLPRWPSIACIRIFCEIKANQTDKNSNRIDFMLPHTIIVLSWAEYSVNMPPFSPDSATDIMDRTIVAGNVPAVKKERR